ncbi:uncharacterized protein LOC124437788 [Xenia sp. Carnegie-2017]|uniref:uncharacterized protein LOC124437788 n=1 Tax=Xenia sp. Carnegie-2017 TaxID=2897299 RepID=UPI001F03C049|nr:uncharacterized protein LOC124437788 [Xenia sp. Carnegie-2017]
MGSSMSLTEEEKTILLEAKQHVKEKGLDGMRDVYKDMMKSWTEVSFKFAITGSNTYLRSSFFKALLSFGADDTNYTHLEHDNKIELCDLPGIETFKNFKSFCQSIGGLNSYDAFLMFCKSKLTCQEKELAEKLSKEFEIPFIFVYKIVDGSSKMVEENNSLNCPKDFVKDGSDLYVIDKKIIENVQNFSTLCEDIIGKLIKRRNQYFVRCFSEEIYKNKHFTEKDRLLAEAKYSITKHGVSGLNELYQKQIDSLKNTEIHLAITGGSGTGKSSFINAVRGLKAHQNGAAQVDVVEKTKVPTSYPHPKIKEIIFCDLPGLRSPETSDLQEYCEKMDLKSYDAILIFGKTRFFHQDRELAKKVSKELGKPFLFIRTNIDHELKNAEDDEGKEFKKESVLKRMRKDSLENLKDLIHDENNIYMIDNKFTSEYDFQRLKESIADILTKEDFIASFKSKTKEIIEFKAKFCKEIALATKALQILTLLKRQVFCMSKKALKRFLLIILKVKRLNSGIYVQLIIFFVAHHPLVAYHHLAVYYHPVAYHHLTF